MQLFGCRARLQILATWLVYLFVLVVSAPAHARCTGNNAITTITLPATLTKPRDGTAGEVLWASGWVGTNISHVTGCQDSVEDRAWGYISAKDKTTVSGVYATNITGVGVQVHWLNTNNQSPTPGEGRSHLVTWPASTGGLDQAQRFNMPARYHLRLVRTGSIAAGKLSLASPLAYTNYGSVRVAQLNISGSTTFAAASCKTPDVTVKLGTHSATSLVAVGSRTPAVKFTLNINSCPAGLTSVKYGFNSPSADYVATQGLVALTSASTARGIKVKLLNADATRVVELDKWYTLSAYNTRVGGSYSVGLSAAYERTSGAAVSPGTANAELTIAMSYN